MSIESAKAFIERMNTDEEFAKRTMEQRGKEQIASFLKTEGFEFSEDEFKEGMQTLGKGELTDEQLSEVAGGATFNLCEGHWMCCQSDALKQFWGF